MRIAEIEGRAGQGVGLDRLPVREIGAGFHHDDLTVRASDGEPEATCPHADAAAADGEGGTIESQQHGWQTVKHRAPARGGRQVIDDPMGVTGENRQIIVWCRRISMKIDSRQAGAVLERRVSNAGDAVADYGVGQAGAYNERTNSEGGDAVGDVDARQAGGHRTHRSRC